MRWCWLVAIACSTSQDPQREPRPERQTTTAAPVADTTPVPAPVADAAPVPVPDAAPVPAAAADPVPPENREVGAPPETVSAEGGAQRLLAAIKADDPPLARDFFFPADAFDLVKDMAVPGRYHRRLVAWYEEDVHAMHDQFRDVATATFERFELGHCAWMDVHTEGNKLPYWSCRRSRIFARAGERPRVFEIHVLINWGRNWYVTHLGPIRN